MPFVFDHGEDVDEENEKNIEKLNEDFISMKGNMSSFEKLKE